jgi:hypothetical protein
VPRSLDMSTWILRRRRHMVGVRPS